MNLADIDLRANLNNLLARIAASARRAGRSPDSVKLVAVTKTVDIDRIEEAYDLGIRDFGENRVQEARSKLDGIAADPSRGAGLRTRAEAGPGHGDVRWHMIGHLQRNKAAQAVSLFDTVESVDSLELAELLSRLALNSGRVLPVLLQVNVSQEPSKHGFSVAALWSAFESLVSLPAIDVRGLMTIAPMVANPERVRPVFRATRQLRDDLQGRFPGFPLPELSMGMTDDFEVAIEEGATIVRVGRVLFGQRST